MKAIVEFLLPPVADNAIRGMKLPVYLFAVLAIVSFVRSCIHVFAPDSGAGSIAGMDLSVAGAPEIVFSFALWGSAQLIYAFIQLVVAFRYRSLVPFMYVLLFLETLFRIMVGRIKPVHFAHTPPGAIGNYAMLPLTALMLVLSFKEPAPRLNPSTPERIIRSGGHMEFHETIRSMLESKGWVVWSVAPETTVLNAVRLMADKDVGALPVVQGGRLVGLFSERDYARKIILHGRASRETPVHEVMTSPAVFVNPDETVDECMRIMTRSRVRHLPVVDDGNVIGIVSIGDLVNWIISAQTETIGQLHSYIAGSYPG